MQAQWLMAWSEPACYIATLHACHCHTGITNLSQSIMCYTADLESIYMVPIHLCWAANQLLNLYHALLQLAYSRCNDVLCCGGPVGVVRKHVGLSAFWGYLTSCLQPVFSMYKTSSEFVWALCTVCAGH